MIYHDSHVTLPVSSGGGCAVDTEVKAWMEAVQNGGGPPAPFAATQPRTDKEEEVVEAKEADAPLTADPATDPSPEYKYTAAANRVKRALKPPSNR